jgi:hypothetical protein
MAAMFLSGVGVAGIAFLAWFFLALCADQRGQIKCVVSVQPREALSVIHQGWRVHSSTRARDTTAVRLQQAIAGKASASADEKRSASV